MLLQYTLLGGAQSPSRTEFTMSCGLLMFVVCLVRSAYHQIRDIACIRLPKRSHAILAYCLLVYFHKPFPKGLASWCRLELVNVFTRLYRTPKPPCRYTDYGAKLYSTTVSKINLPCRILRIMCINSNVRLSCSVVLPRGTLCASISSFINSTIQYEETLGGLGLVEDLVFP